MLQLYTYVIDITSKPLFFVHFVDDVDLNVTFQVFLFSLVGLKCCSFLFFFFFSDLHHVRWGNKTAKLKIPWIIFCHIYSSLCSPTYLHATLCPLGKQLFTQKLKLYSLEASSHKHFHTESHSLYSFFCKCRFSLSARLWAYSQSGNKKKSQTEWKDEIRVVAATLRHSPPTFISPRMLRGPKSSRLTLHTNTSVEGKSAFAATRRAVGS